MSKYKVIYDGEFEDAIFNTIDEAEEYAMQMISESKQGAEDLNMSNPGDYDADDYDDEYEIVEVDD